MSYLFGISDAERVLYRIDGFIDRFEQDPVVAQTFLGTPVYDQLIFPAEANPEIELSTDFILNDVIFRVRRPKLIKRTQVAGRDGEVNELISLGDYQIEIFGKIVSEQPLIKPVDRIRDLIKIDNHKGSVAVAVRFLGWFDIDSIVIDDTELSQEEGVYNEQPFIMRARSENPVELQLQSPTL